MNNKLVSNSGFHFGSYLFPVLVFLIFSQTIAGQDEPPNDVAPPPLKLISKDEKKLLDDENDAKKRVKKSFELMDARLVKAEKLQVAESYRESLNELAGFHAILDQTLTYLIDREKVEKKLEKRFIDFEIYLRKQIPRLETIRRETPNRYGYHIGRIMVAVREARAKAVEPLFSDSVVPGAKSNEN